MVYVIGYLWFIFQRAVLLTLKIGVGDVDGSNIVGRQNRFSCLSKVRLSRTFLPII